MKYFLKIVLVEIFTLVVNESNKVFALDSLILKVNIMIKVILDINFIKLKSK